MTNKRKKRVKSIRSKTGLSHQGALNQLNKEKVDIPPDTLVTGSGPGSGRVEFRGKFYYEPLYDLVRTTVGVIKRRSPSWAPELDEEIQEILGESPTTTLSPHDERCALAAGESATKTALDRMEDIPLLRGQIREFLKGQDTIGTVASVKGRPSPHMKPAGFNLDDWDFRWIPLEDLPKWKTYRLRVVRCGGDEMTEDGHIVSPLELNAVLFLATLRVAREAALRRNLELLVFTTPPGENGSVKALFMALPEAVVITAAHAGMVSDHPKWLLRLLKRYTSQDRGSNILLRHVKSGLGQ